MEVGQIQLDALLRVSEGQNQSDSWSWPSCSLGANPRPGSSGCRQNSIPCGCRTEILTSSLAFGQRSPSFLEAACFPLLWALRPPTSNGAPPATAPSLPRLPPLLKAPVITSGPPGEPRHHLPLKVNERSTITTLRVRLATQGNSSLGATAHHIPCPGEQGINSSWGPKFCLLHSAPTLFKEM